MAEIATELTELNDINNLSLVFFTSKASDKLSLILYIIDKLPFAKAFGSFFFFKRIVFATNFFMGQKNAKFCRTHGPDKRLVKNYILLFSGGELADDDLDAMMKAIQDAYRIAKENNKKFKPKKNMD